MEKSRHATAHGTAQAKHMIAEMANCVELFIMDEQETALETS